MRPTSLRDVCERVRRSLYDGDDSGAFEHHLNEFLDRFYLSHGDRDAQSAMLCDDAGRTGLRSVDAFVGGAAEHLARRWHLPIPSWVRQPDRYLDRPIFSPSDRNLRSFLFIVSPVAFRVRLIFTGPDPLQRARFPTASGSVSFPARLGVAIAGVEGDEPPRQ